MRGEPSVRRLVGRSAIWLAIVAGLLLVLGATTHLVYVAETSQPDCVPHLRQGQDGAPPGAFSAAQSACSPPAPSRGAQDSEWKVK